MTISLGKRVSPEAPRIDVKLAGSRAGAAKVKLPWLKDIILTGWGPFQPLGVRHAKACDRIPLQVRALVLEDPWGERVALVALDLHGGSRYVTEKAAAALAAEGFHAGNLFLSATHNHAGPGGMYGSPYYDGFAASTELGKPSPFSRLALNRKLADHVSARVVEAILEAVKRLTRAQIGQSAEWSGWARNRSLKAFRNNFPRLNDDQIKPLLVEALGSQMGELDAMAVDSRVHTIAAFEEAAPNRLIGSFSTFAAHCALLSRAHPRQSPDFFGHATDAAEKKLEADQGSLPIIALAAGAIGDCDPMTPWELLNPNQRTLKEWLKLRDAVTTNDQLIQQHATQLATGLRASIDSARGRMHRIERLTVAFSENRIAEDTLANGTQMTDQARIGTSTIAGSELGTGDLPKLKLWFSEDDGVEKRQKFKADPHFPKRFRPLLPPKYGVPLEGTKRALAHQHDQLALRLVQIQCRDFAEPIRLLGLPGEPTTWLSHQLNQLLKRGSAHRPAMVAGVTGDYQGYLTTIGEYDAQQYEGSSTIWGRQTQTWLEEKVKLLVDEVETVAAGTRQKQIPTGEVTFNAAEEDDWRTEFFDASGQPRDGEPAPDGVWHLE